MRIILSLGFLISNILAFAQLDKSAVYKALQSEDEMFISAQRKLAESFPAGSERNALLGTLLMKESAFLSTPKQKLDQFKRGKGLLEKEISTHNSNVEYRFLRLLIQENAPKMLGYNKQIAEDSKLIAGKLSSLPSSLQTTIRSYAKNSPALKAQGIK